MNPLAQYLERNKETDSSFARRSGVPQSTVWRIANDKVRPTPDNALKVERATGGEVNKDDLLYPKGQQPDHVGDQQHAKA